MASSEQKSIAVLISGGGTTLKNLISKIEDGMLDAAIGVVISSNPNAGGLQFGVEAGIRNKCVERSDYDSDTDFSEAIFSICREVNVDYVVMGGFLKRVVIPDDFTNKVVNIHPSLIPAFCGKGFYGHHVHEAVLQYGARVTGCTIHFVDDEYDHGPIILQRTVLVKDGDTADSLAARVFEAECEAYPTALNLLINDRVSICGRTVQISK